jgi:CheY-like chemotaxis protein
MDGFSLCQEVKAHPAWKSIPFVLLTSLSRNLRERSAHAGADDYLSKLEDDLVFRLRAGYLLELGVSGNTVIPTAGSQGAGSVFLASASSTIRTQLGMQLQPAGIRVHAVAGLPELARDLECRRPGLVVLDFDQDGGNLSEWLPSMRQMKGCGHLPVMVLAAKGEDSQLQPLQAWIHDRLIKPLEAQDTRHRVNLLLQLERARRLE